MTETIENPTADQLEAGGTITGTYCGLPFTDWPLVARMDVGTSRFAHVQLCAGQDNGPRIRCINGEFSDSVTVTSYTPPEPKPWWETCDANEWGIGEFGRNTVVRTAGWWREMRRQVKVNPRRVRMADADTEVIVPKAAVDQLREAVDTYGHAAETDEALAAARIAVYIAATTLLAAVDERGES